MSINMYGVKYDLETDEQGKYILVGNEKIRLRKDNTILMDGVTYNAKAGSRFSRKSRSRRARRSRSRSSKSLQSFRR